ncbi:MAG TPA: hypothetical protein VKB17_07480 [Thermoleophilaceae bacterium]|nr:hypothetical protein [Thermoleophilaceae bacterium]
MNRPFKFFAVVVVLALAALVAPVAASAKKPKGHGVRAELRHGTLEVKGNKRANTVALRLKAGDSNTVQVDVGDDASPDFSFARSELSAIKIRMGGGKDSVRIDDANGAFTDSIPTTIAGGRGNDSLNGGLGAETFRGGRGKDTVLGGKGNDTAYLGRGNDSFRWDPGDGSDVIEGQRGRDTMLFNGAAANETVMMTANGRRLTFFRNPGNVTMDTRGVETVDFNALGGTDNVTVNDLTGTDVRRTNLDLAGTLGGSAGDGAVDNVVAGGTNGDDRIRINGTGSGADVTGLATAVSVRHADPTDRLSVNTLEGTDNVLVNGVAGVLQVLVNGVPA